MTESIPTIEEGRNSNRSGTGVNFEEIAELEKPFLKILREMLPNIEKGEYDLIIGVDASGRIPTLIMERFIKHIYSKKEFVTPNVGFVAGNINTKNAEKVLDRWNPSRKVLIVEDTVSTGKSISEVCSILKRDGIKFDIATVGFLPVNDLGETDKTIADELGAENIFFGSVSVPGIYGNHQLAGVSKTGEGKAFSKSYKREGDEAGFETSDDQEAVIQARSDVDLVTRGLIDWYESQNHEK